MSATVNIWNLFNKMEILVQKYMKEICCNIVITYHGFQSVSDEARWFRFKILSPYLTPK
jgi:hypothetical protein